MSGTLSSNYFESAEIVSNTKTRTTETLTNKMFRQQIGGQYWTIKLSSVALDRDEMGELYSFLVKQNGQYESFALVPPVIQDSGGTATGTPTITQSYSAGVSSVRANGGSGTLKAGDYIKFSNHDKVYMLTADVNQDASSEDTFEFFPILSTAVTNTVTIQYADVPFNVILTTDQLAFKTSADGTYEIEFSVREDI
jgi:hypothetical protein